MSITKTILSPEEINNFIMKGITDAKGSVDAIEFLTEQDCLKLGEELANREAIHKTEFFSIVCEPINDIEEGKAKGHYDSIYDHINPKTVPLQKAEGVKRIYFIPVTERVEEGKEAEFLAKFGKRPVTNAPNYLLGAMAKLTEDELPENLKLKDFVAVSGDEKEVFSGHLSRRCFLICDRRDGRRRLDVVALAGAWNPEDVWCFLAEDAS